MHDIVTEVAKLHLINYIVLVLLLFFIKKYIHWKFPNYSENTHNKNLIKSHPCDVNFKPHTFKHDCFEINEHNTQ